MRRELAEIRPILKSILIKRKQNMMQQDEYILREMVAMQNNNKRQRTQQSHGGISINRQSIMHHGKAGYPKEQFYHKNVYRTDLASLDEADKVVKIRREQTKIDEDFKKGLIALENRKDQTKKSIGVTKSQQKDIKLTKYNKMSLNEVEDLFTYLLSVMKKEDMIEYE